ncbi:MAG: ABC transporter permease [Bacillus sp. (in: firmicutes)]
MMGFFTLLHKEFLGLWRSKKFIWLPIVFMLLMVMQPITYYFMDDIMKLGGNLPEGAVFEMPLPSAAEVMASVLSQLNTLGILLIVVAAMGCISDERRNGALTLLLVRPVSYVQLVMSKMISYSVLFVFSFVCGYLLSYYYTVILFEELSMMVVWKSMLVYGLYIIFSVACVVFTSALFTSNGAIAIVNILFFSGLSVLSGWLTTALKWSPTRLSGYASNIIMGESDSALLGCIVITIILIVIMQLLTAIVVKKKNA